MIFDMFFNTKINSLVDNSLRSPSRRRFLSIGGLPFSGMSLDKVYIVDLDTKSICLHSELPVGMKEVHAYNYNGALLICTTFTLKTPASFGKKNLQCYSWSTANGWEEFAVDPVTNGIFGFIHTVQVPGVGIWFQDNNANTLTLKEDGTWVSGVHLTNLRLRHCTVMISPTVAAMIGGNSPTVKFVRIILYEKLTFLSSGHY